MQGADGHALVAATDYYISDLETLGYQALLGISMGAWVCTIDPAQP
jgi:hypothetical protein